MDLAGLTWSCPWLGYSRIGHSLMSLLVEHDSKRGCRAVKRVSEMILADQQGRYLI